MLIEIALLILALLAYFYWSFNKALGFWSKHGIWQLQTSFTETMSLIVQRTHISLTLDTMYKKAKAQGYAELFGISFGTFPILVMSDPDMVKNVLIKDFDIFVNRNLDVFGDMMEQSPNKANRIWANTMLNLNGERWKEVRSTFSPIFTSGRMKAMTVLMKESVSQLVKAFNREIPEQGQAVVELKDMLGKYSMDVIASCAFGVNAKAFSDAEADKEFVGNAAQFFRKTPYDAFLQLLLQIPYVGDKIINLLGLSFVKEKEINFFYDVVKQTLESRITTKSKRNDIIDLMIEAIRGELKHDHEHEDDEYEKDAKLKTQSKLKTITKEDEEIIMVATAMVMMVAGYDTTAMTLSYVCYELAKNPDIQDRLREEVDEAYAKKEDEDCPALDYQDVQFLEYLDQTINEALRLHPPAGAVTRCSAKDYTIPGTSKVVPKNSLILFPTLSIHLDPDNYPNPEKFDPDRFSKEGKAKRNPYRFLPFGHGPRSCVGMRFALLEAKLGLAALVRHFEIVPCDKTVDTIEIDSQSFLYAPKGGLHVAFRKRF